MRSLEFVFLGLTLTSTWGNGHATTYRALLKQLSQLGHRVTFLERDVPWYADNREFTTAPYCDLHLYAGLDQLREQHGNRVRNADVVIVGSYVPDGVAVGNLVTSITKGLPCFYDIDTPVTLAALQAGTCGYLSFDLCRQYQLYLSFTGGPTLRFIEEKLGSPAARALYCSVDPELYYPDRSNLSDWAIGYLGTYAADRQPSLDRLLLHPAEKNPDKRFTVAGPQYPAYIHWPPNVDRLEHLPAVDHRRFYNSQQFTLNLTRQDMVKAGYSPSVRLFEAAACGTPILSDEWPGLESFLKPGSEVLPVRNAGEVTSYLQMPFEERNRVGVAARTKVLQFHTAAVRARQLTSYVVAAMNESCRLNRGSLVGSSASNVTAAV